MPTYITFGQDHRHEIGGKVFDKNCVAQVDLPEEEARAIFMPKFCMSYDSFDKVKLEHFPDGIRRLDILPDRDETQSMGKSS